MVRNALVKSEAGKGKRDAVRYQGRRGVQPQGEGSRGCVDPTDRTGRVKTPRGGCLAHSGSSKDNTVARVGSEGESGRR